MIKTILFDIDGVFLSEERYFDASALTVYELIHSPHYLGLPPEPVHLPPFSPHPSEEDVVSIRRIVFADDRVLNEMKSVGVNANWDMVYLQFTYQLIRVLQGWVNESSAEQVMQVLAPYVQSGWGREALACISNRLHHQAPSPIDYSAFSNTVEACRTKDDLFDRLETDVRDIFCSSLSGEAEYALPRLDTNMELWTVCQQTFQEWYLGDAYVDGTHQPGKAGYLTNEAPIVPVEAVGELFQNCIERGITIGIGTGRPRLETMVPFATYRWVDYFSSARITTATDVLEAEQTLQTSVPLSKPNPFSYMRSYLGCEDVQRILDTPLPLNPESGCEVLVVGDSVADLLAARAMGCRFAAVLTGLEGEKARTQFAELDADFIWNTILDLRKFLEC